MKYTKGEFKIGYNESKIQIYSDNDGIAEHICELPDQSEKSEANAKIMAASKDLASALLMAERHINLFTPKEFKNPELMQVIRNAFNKVTE